MALSIFFNSSIYNPIQVAQALGAVATAVALFFVYKQNKASKVQQFESTLFNLINLQNNIVTNIQKGDKDVFSEAVKELNTALGSELKEAIPRFGGWHPQSTPIRDLDHAKEIYKAQYLKLFYQHHEEEFNHYFRNLYHILKYLHLTNLIPDRKKQFYASLLRAQLSQNQLHVWMFNAMWPGHGNPNALYLIKRYNMLDNFNERAVKPELWWDLFNELLTTVQTPKNLINKRWKF